MKTGRTIAGLTLLAGLAFGGGVAAHEGHDMDAAKGGKKAVTITGEVIDVACYVTDGAKGRGADHTECGTKCVSGGMPVGLLTADGKVYLAVTDDHTTAKDLLLPYFAKTVKATGYVSTRAGVRLIAIEKVEEAAAPKAAAAAKAPATVQKEVWICPMGDFTGDKPGKCPKCGMDLVKKG